MSSLTHTSNTHRHQHAEVSQRLEKIRVGWTVAGAFLAQHVRVSPTKVLSRHESHVWKNEHLDTAKEPKWIDQAFIYILSYYYLDVCVILYKYIYIYISINKCIYIILNPIFWWAFVIREGTLGFLKSWKFSGRDMLGLISGLTNGLVLGRLGASWITKAIFLFDRLLGWTLDLGIQHSAYREIILREFVWLCGHLSAMMLDCFFPLCRSVVRWRGTTGSVIEVDLTGELWPACPETRETRHLLIPKAVSDYGATLGRTLPSNSRIFSFDRCKLSAVSWSIRKGQQVGCRCLSVGDVF